MVMWDFRVLSTPGEPSVMWSFILYVAAVIVGLFLFWSYEPKAEREDGYDDTDHPNPRQQRKKAHDFRFSSLFAALGLNWETINHFQAFTEHFHTFQEVSYACRRAGLDSSNLVIAVDFTASNEWQGRKSFHQNCLHKISGHKVHNPYQKVIWILGQALAPFDEDNLIPAYGFGDSETTDEDVFSFKYDESPCQGFQDVLDKYNEVVRRITLSGPTSFAPIIRKAIEIVQETKSYHILVIVADGQVTEERMTIDAIVEASNHPISIIVIGVGDGPWDIMEEFDHRLPKRKFDNFRFVDYHKATFKCKNPDTAFALQALMEIPDQYKTIRALGYLPDPSEKPNNNNESMTDSADSASTGSNSRRDGSPRGSPHTSPQHRSSSFSAPKMHRGSPINTRHRVVELQRSGTSIL